MSLINEALKRARLEAARRDAAEKGVPQSALPVHLPRGSRPWLAPVAGFVAGLAAVGVAAGAFWLARQPMPEAGVGSAPVAEAAGTAQAMQGAAPAMAASPPAAQQPPAAPPTAVQQPPAAPTPVAQRPPAAPPTAAPPTAVQQLPAALLPAAPTSAAQQPPAAPTFVAQQPPAAPTFVAQQPPAAAPDTRQPTMAPSPLATGDRATYFREAAPSGTRIKVDFIVWSESRPFAQINGHLLSAGQTVDGYTLLEVERERVELEGGGVRFWIRVR